MEALTLPWYHIDDLPEEYALLIREHPRSGCWIWRGLLGPAGHGTYKNKPAHRIIYTLLVGPIPDGLVLDHVRARGCISNACVWPAHLEPVTVAENSRRWARRDRTPMPTTAATPIGAGKFRNDLTRVLLDIDLKGAHYEIQNNDYPKAVVVPCDWYGEARAALEARRQS
jgi:hypothetical protein